MNREHPYVCANCKWCDVDKSDDARRYGGGGWCHYNPGPPIFVNGDSWCAMFAVTVNRRPRMDLQYPPYQVVADE